MKLVVSTFMFWTHASNVMTWHLRHVVVCLPQPVGLAIARLPLMTSRVTDMHVCCKVLGPKTKASVSKRDVRSRWWTSWWAGRYQATKELHQQIWRTVVGCRGSCHRSWCGCIGYFPTYRRRLAWLFRLCDSTGAFWLLKASSQLIYVAAVLLLLGLWRDLFRLTRDVRTLQYGQVFRLLTSAKKHLFDATKNKQTEKIAKFDRNGSRPAPDERATTFHANGRALPRVAIT